MRRYLLSEIAPRIDAVAEGTDAAITGVSTDTRSIAPGELFVAIRGERFDGHDFVGQAAARGAAAVMLSHPAEVALPRLRVADTRRALGRLARVWREDAAPRLVAVTGSNGKTTVKEMIAAILRQRGGVLATEGNLNNDIGVPLTLTRLQDEQFAVVELGANHAGEIGYLSGIARPDVAVLNNAQRAHLEGFGSAEGVARAKAEIIEGLAADGVFVFLADAPWSTLWQTLAAGRTWCSFGLSAAAQVRSPGAAELRWTDDGFRSEFAVQTPHAEFELALRLAGEHNRLNALAAVAASQALGASPQEIMRGLASLRPVPGRLCPSRTPRGVCVIDDTYNANPDSVEAALDVLARAPGRRILVLGDLAELGSESQKLHAELGDRARAAGIDGLLTLGEASAETAHAFGANAQHCDDINDLLGSLTGTVRSGDSVLVKGSRSSRMERVVEALLAAEAMAC